MLRKVEHLGDIDCTAVEHLAEDRMFEKPEKRDYLVNSLPYQSALMASAFELV